MRKLAFVLLATSLLIAGARLFTGVVYLKDEPTAALVLKGAPAMWIERGEDEDHPFSEQIVLDIEEPDLVYGQLYRWLMNAAPILVASLAGASALSMAMASRRRQSR